MDVPREARTQEPIDGPSDAEVISASLTHGAEFTLIYERYFDAIYRYVAARLGADAAADIASEVFVRAFENRRSYDLERPLARPWLYGIAANLIRDSLRSRSRRRRAYLRTAGFGDDPEAQSGRPSPIMAT